MIVARYNHGQLIVLDRLREMVRLAAGLDEFGRLSRESTQRALQCLERFGQRLRDMRAESVRVVAPTRCARPSAAGCFSSGPATRSAIPSKSSPVSRKRA